MPDVTVTSEYLNDLRQRYLDGKDWTRDELRAAISAMCDFRAVASTETPKRKTKEPTVKIALDDLL